MALRRTLDPSGLFAEPNADPYAQTPMRTPLMTPSATGTSGMFPTAPPVPVPFDFGGAGWAGRQTPGYIPPTAYPYDPTTAAPSGDAGAWAPSAPRPVTPPIPEPPPAPAPAPEPAPEPAPAPPPYIGGPGDPNYPGPLPSTGPANPTPGVPPPPNHYGSYGPYLGWDQAKLNDPNHQSIKYQFLRTMLDAGINSQARDLNGAVAALQAAGYPVSAVPGSSDRIMWNGVGQFDIFNGTNGDFFFAQQTDENGNPLQGQGGGGAGQGVPPPAPPIQLPPRPVPPGVWTAEDSRTLPGPPARVPLSSAFPAPTGVPPTTSASGFLPVGTPTPVPIGTRATTRPGQYDATTPEQAADIAVGADPLSGNIDAAISSLLGSGSTPYGNEIADMLRNVYSNGGLYNSPAVKQQLVAARDAEAGAFQGQLADARGALASRGLISTPGVGQGAEATAIDRVSQGLAPEYASAVSKIETDAMERANQNVLSALSLATGLSQSQANNMLGAISAGTNRQAVLANIALQSLAQNQSWIEFLANYGLNQDALQYQIEHGRMQDVIALVTAYLQYGQINAGGYIPGGGTTPTTPSPGRGVPRT